MGYLISLLAILMLTIVLINNISFKNGKKRNKDKYKRNNIIYLALTLVVTFLLSYNISKNFNYITISTILIQVIITNILVSRLLSHYIYKVSKKRKSKRYEIKRELLRVISFFIIVSLLTILFGAIKQMSLYYLLGIIALLAVVSMINIKNIIKDFSKIR